MGERRAAVEDMATVNAVGSTLFQGHRLFVILDIANNHVGSVAHGLRIIREVHAVTRRYSFRFAVKFQYRQLETFIHPQYRNRFDLQYVKRFSETSLPIEAFSELKAEAERLGFTTMCTPFDERSVDIIEAQQFDVIKIGSCSFTDWPLLERVVRADRPIVASTAATSLDDMDRVVSFLEHRDKTFALMHCVAEYPTARERLELNQLGVMRTRYPDLPLGFSTHENPDDTEPVQMAIAKGATLLERHVGVATAEWPLNAYSSSPAQLAKWLDAAERALAACGIQGARAAGGPEELTNLSGLRRGVFVTRDQPSGSRLSAADVFFAIPLVDGQLTANEWSKYAEFTTTAALTGGAAVMRADVNVREVRARVAEIVGRVRTMLDESRVAVPGKADFEISHHYGLDRFDDWGITMLTVVNREYCKKLIVLLPGQRHPEQYHCKKEETFHVLDGGVDVTLDGCVRRCVRGDVVVVERGVRHSLSSETGAVLEEISSSHHTDDSFYTDPEIARNQQRKTYVTYWLG